MTAQASLLEYLRSETSTIHARVEALPFVAALQSGTLPRAAYIRFLEAMATVHEALEQACTSRRDPVLAACWDVTSRRLPLLDRDLIYFQAERSATASWPLLHAIMLAEEIALRAQHDSASLVGTLYVLQGPALGGLVLRPQVARAFGLDGPDGLAYLTGNARQTSGIWTTFTTVMNMAGQYPALHPRAVEAAIESFEGIEHVMRTLFPPAGQPVPMVGGALNPEAGTHAIVADPREIRAALRAGARSWDRFPYYAFRYGRRGRRFTRSDSAWLVTLAALPQTAVDRHVLWLGQVLAARGMPRWLLEEHLEELYAELVQAVPERREDYDRLHAAAERLRQERLAVLPAEQWRSLEAGFDAAVGPDWARRLPRSGGLLIAAVSDEAAGVKNAVTSLAGWMTDPERFPVHWLAAVRQTLDEARRLARPAG